MVFNAPATPNAFTDQNRSRNIVSGSAVGLLTVIALHLLFAHVSGIGALAFWPLGIGAGCVTLSLLNQSSARRGASLLTGQILLIAGLTLALLGQVV